jgi:hypothetical protein
MENVPRALVGRIQASGALDRAQLAAWTMVNTKSVSTSVEPSTGQIVAVEAKSETAPLSSGFTLRVKPDRRRAQVPIPAGFDRRCSR